MSPKRDVPQERDLRSSLSHVRSGCAPRMLLTRSKWAASEVVGPLHVVLHCAPEREAARGQLRHVLRLAHWERSAMYRNRAMQQPSVELSAVATSQDHGLEVERQEGNRVSLGEEM